MSMGVSEFFKGIFKPAPVQPPEDHQLFEEAKRRLTTATRNVIREADEFGKMLRDMQGVPPRKLPAKKTRPSKKS
jgi:hypothetical protein